MSGTSMATPTLAGIALVVQEWLASLGARPTADLVKAVFALAAEPVPFVQVIIALVCECVPD